jgi:hypothetical protein
MATKFVTNLDLNQNQILNGTFEKLAADPSTGLFEGRTFYHTGEDALKYYTGSAWDTLIKGISAAGSYASALTVGESNGAITLTLNLADASNAGLLSATFYSLLNGATATNTNDTLVKRDASGRFQATSPSADADVATKSYVDAQRSGLDVKQSVRAATTEALTLASDFENGDVVDGVTLVTGDRILIKNQGTASENGIYVVAASGAPTRATDADSNTEVTPGMFTFVEEGTVNADSGWVLTTNGSITLGTTSLAFAQFSGAGQITAGGGLTKTGNQLDVGGTTDRITVNADSVDIASTYVGQSSITTLGTITTGTWTATDVAVDSGGTGASTASGARTNLGETTAGFSTSTPVLARVAAQSIGNSTDTTFTITHNFGTRDVVVQVFDNSTYETVIADTVRASTNTVTISFTSTPANNAYRVVVTG